MPSPETFCDVLEHLNRENARYVVVGGFAVVMHGHKRDIADLDIVIDPSPPEAQRCLHALALAGFTPTILLPVEMVSVIRLFDPLAREVNVFLRSAVSFEKLWPRAKFVQVGYNMARIAAFEDLLEGKRIVGRGSDVADVEALMRLNAID
ncbi:MAG TPA: hypothetical protein VJ656_01810 [Pyrinomonadaceae bacterium]|nr:hypothetical protein [Pyrinomonadaceae bacterium]